MAIETGDMVHVHILGELTNAQANYAWSDTYAIAVCPPATLPDARAGLERRLAEACPRREA